MKKQYYTIKRKRNKTAVYYGIIIAAAALTVILSRPHEYARINTELYGNISVIEYEIPEYTPVEVSGYRMQDNTAVYAFVDNYPGSRLAGRARQSRAKPSDRA